MHVADNADDGSPVLQYAGPDAVTSCALAWPFAICEGLVDDGDVARAVIGAGEVAAGEQGLADGGEVAGSDLVRIRIHRDMLLAALGMRIGAEVRAIDSVPEWRMVGGRNGSDAR